MLTGATWDPVGQTVESDRDIPREGLVQGQGHLWSLPLCGPKKAQGVQGSLVGWGHFLYAQGSSWCLQDEKAANAVTMEAAVLSGRMPGALFSLPEKI